MMLSELILRLTATQHDHGDIEVLAADMCCFREEDMRIDLQDCIDQDDFRHVITSLVIK